MTRDDDPITVPTCPGCGKPAHATESDDDGYHEGCRDEDISDSQIEALLVEAGAAGDMEMVAICRAALCGDAGSRALCTRYIAEAAAQDDDEGPEPDYDAGGDSPAYRSAMRDAGRGRLLP